MAEAEATDTLQAIASFLLPALLDLLRFYLLTSLPTMQARGGLHVLPSYRRAVRARMRYNPRHLTYHRFKRRKKKKHRFRRRQRRRYRGQPAPISLAEQRRIGRRRYWCTMGWTIIQHLCSLESVLHPFMCRIQRCCVAFMARAWPRGTSTSSFDSDAIHIHIDSGCSYTISPNPEHFIDLDRSFTGNCNGFADGPSVGNPIAGRGTFVFSIQDDDGKWHVIKIPGALYIPKARHVLLSPQHWCQSYKDHAPIKDGTRCVHGASDATIEWSQRRFRKTVPYSRVTNTPIFSTAPGFG